MKHYDHVVAFLTEHPWAILPKKLETIASLIQLRIDGITLTDAEIEANIGAARSREKRPQTDSEVAVIPVLGTIAHRMNMFSSISGGTSTEVLGKTITAAVNDPAVSGIVLDIDSPGGSVFGIEELHNRIMASRGRKPIVAQANAMAASAAYYIASAADEIVVTPSGEVGSIGVVGVHLDQSKAMEDMGIKPTIITAGKNKAEGNPFEALTGDALAHFQESIDTYYGMFVKAVAKGRDVPVKDVRGERFGEGRMFPAREALTRGLVDRVDIMENTIQRVAKQGAAQQKAENAQTLFINMCADNIAGFNPETWTSTDTIASPSIWGPGETPKPQESKSVATLRAELDTLEEEVRVRKDLQ